MGRGRYESNIVSQWSRHSMSHTAKERESEDMLGACPLPRKLISHSFYKRAACLLACLLVAWLVHNTYSCRMDMMP